mgnify:CR=1 FL=1
MNDRVLGGRFHLDRLLGRGGMAEVYLAKQSGLEGFEKLVVIKRILPHLAEHEAFVEMFLQEARFVSRLSHPNVVQIYELGEVDDPTPSFPQPLDVPLRRTEQAEPVDDGVRHDVQTAASRCHQIGVALAQSVPDPVPGEGQIVLRVRAAAEIVRSDIEMAQVMTISFPDDPVVVRSFQVREGQRERARDESETDEESTDERGCARLERRRMHDGGLPAGDDFLWGRSLRNRVANRCHAPRLKGQKR